jgi:hypothetical protein
MAANNKGKITQVIGAVLDIKFSGGDLPEINDAIEIFHKDSRLVAEVAQHLGDDTVRCIAMGPTDGLVRGMEAVATGGPISMPVGEITLCGLTEQQQRRQSHRPQDFYDQPHFMPEPEDGPAIAALNRARCAARAAELQGVDTFSDRDGCPTRPDIVQALNRMSSMLYILMIREKARQSRK